MFNLAESCEGFCEKSADACSMEPAPGWSRHLNPADPSQSIHNPRGERELGLESRNSIPPQLVQYLGHSEVGKMVIRLSESEQESNRPGQDLN